jgi:hypothetical protein
VRIKRRKRLYHPVGEMRLIDQNTGDKVRDAIDTACAMCRERAPLRTTYRPSDPLPCLSHEERISVVGYARSYARIHVRWGTTDRWSANRYSGSRAGRGNRDRHDRLTR